VCSEERKRAEGRPSSVASGPALTEEGNLLSMRGKRGRNVSGKNERRGMESPDRPVELGEKAVSLSKDFS